MSITLDDHIFQLQWDDSKITKGFQDLERKFNKFKVKVEWEMPKNKPRFNQQRSGVSTASNGSLGEEKLRRLTSSQRFTFTKDIEKTQTRLRQTSDALKKLGTKEAAVLAKNLDKRVDSLSRTLNNLKNVAYNNSKAFENLKTNVINAKEHLRSANKQLGSMTRRMDSQLTVSNSLSQSMRNLARSYVSVFAAISGVTGFKRIAADMQNIKVASLLASGSLQQQKQDLKFVDELTERLGLRYKDTAKAFATFKIGAVSGGVSQEDAKTIFTQISEGLASSATSAESAKLAFLGFRQMISGTVVQAQEINQIVDQVPAFIGAATQALDEMGIRSADHLDETGKSFKDTIKTAGVNAKEFTSIVARILSEQGKATGATALFAKSITAEENRAFKKLEKAIEGMANNGLADLITTSYKGLAVVIETLTPLLNAFSVAVSGITAVISTPLKLIDQLAQSLGMSEGEGLQTALRMVAAYLLLKFFPVTRKLNIMLYKTRKATRRLGKSFLEHAKSPLFFSKSVEKLTLSLKSLMRTIWPLLAIEVVINAFQGLSDLFSETTDKYTNLSAAAQQFAQDQYDVNKALEEGNWVLKGWTRFLEYIRYLWNKITSGIKEDIADISAFITKLSFKDQAETLGKEALETISFGGLQFDTPLDDYKAKQEFIGKTRAMQVISVSRNIDIRADINVNGGDLEEAREVFRGELEDWTQNMYSGGA